jgi:RNA polymerase sigma-70 factor, ECF subfamily
VENAISQLEPKQLMLIMMYKDGLSYREMAEATGIREQSVGKTLWRIIDGLASSIKKQDNNE